MYQKYTGIVLRETLLNEADKILNVFTQTDGVLTVKAKGITKTKSKSASACQLFCYSDFVLYEKNGRYTLTEATPIACFENLQSDLVRFALAGYFAELTELVAQADIIPEETMRLLLNMLYALNSNQIPCEQIRAVFECRTLKNAGYMPELSVCQHCYEALSEENVYFYAEEFICEECHREQESGSKVLKGTVAALKYILQSQLKQCLRFTLDSVNLAQLCSVTEALVKEHIGGNASRKYYKEISLWK